MKKLTHRSTRAADVDHRDVEHLIEYLKERKKGPGK
jgi:hypothetical protein